MKRGVLAGRARRERGAAAVEFALIVPVLLLLVFGIINFGDMLSVRQSVSQAASEGARAAAVEADASKRITSGEKAAADALTVQGNSCGTTGCKVEVKECTNDAGKQCAYVTVRVRYNPLIPGYGLLLPKDLTYTAVARVS